MSFMPSTKPPAQKYGADGGGQRWARPLVPHPWDEEFEGPALGSYDLSGRPAVRVPQIQLDQSYTGSAAYTGRWSLEHRPSWLTLQPSRSGGYQFMALNTYYALIRPDLTVYGRSSPALCSPSTTHTWYLTLADSTGNNSIAIRQSMTSGALSYTFDRYVTGAHTQIASSGTVPFAFSGWAIVKQTNTYTGFLLDDTGFAWTLGYYTFATDPHLVWQNWELDTAGSACLLGGDNAGAIDCIRYLDYATVP